jgi:hypothetical protein
VPERHLRGRNLPVIKAAVHELMSSVGVLIALGSSGCLVTNDYGLQDEPAGIDQVTVPSTPPPPVCDEGAPSCVGRDLLRCVVGRWELEAECAADATCSATLGRCASCEPGVEHRCNEGRLERCRDDGTDYDLLEDCAAAGKVCDVELSYDRCLDCRGADHQCGEGVLHKCVAGQFVDAGACEVGGCRVVDGRRDYCPECPRPGQEACGVVSRVVCSELLRFEELEACSDGCAFDGGVTHCL